jgi:glycylpeptide N-tetradecanoyltransferase
VLIKEVTRRVNLQNRWQAVYTAGVVLPKPVARCQYFHRSINPKKLFEVGFSRLSARSTLAKTVKSLKLRERPYADWDHMEPRDVGKVTELLSTYLQRTKLCPVLSEADVTHWLLPRLGVINSYVIRNEAGEVTDFTSFYHLPSTIIGNAKHSILRAVYAYYNVGTTMSMHDLMRDALILARNLQVDVFNALDLMENRDFFQELKFGPGDGHLQYYLYNWKCPEIASPETGLVLL